MVNVAIILGTRPEIIKMAPIIRECQKKKIKFFILHSGQHYDANLDKIFFEELELPAPKYNLNTGSKEYRKQVGNMMKGMRKILLKEQPDAVLVQGDTLTVLMGALAAKKWDIPVGHIEAGLRSHDLTMPEENNRIIVDHISEFLFAPTPDSIENIKDEGLNAQFVSFTTNTVVDAVFQNIKLSDSKSKIIEKLKLKKYFLVTAHRQENTDRKLRLQGIINGLQKVKKAYPTYDIVFPLHPRTKNRLKEFGIKIPKGIKVIAPVGFLDMLQLEKNASLCITDSGGVQEEASILRVPCVTIRDNTERPETIKAGMNILAGANADKILRCVKKMLKSDIKWKMVFGDGTAAKKIVSRLVKQIKVRKSFNERLKWARRVVKRNLRI